MRTSSLAATAALAVACTTAIGPVAAATLGGVSAPQVTGLQMVATPGAPTVVAWADFTGTNGTSLNGKATNGGSRTWSVNPSGGSWTISSNAARSTAANSSLVIDAGSSSGSAVVTLSRNGATTFDVGLTANRNSGGTQSLTAEWTNASNGTLQLRRFNGSWTTLASVTNLYPGGIATAPASITLTLTSAPSGVITASIGGTPVVSTTLSAADQTTFKNATHQLFGLYQRTSNGVTFDTFHMDSP